MKLGVILKFLILNYLIGEEGEDAITASGDPYLLLALGAVWSGTLGAV